ncbi:antitoxin [Verminephrobacter aporrectodeae subsp. tuberculatae]|uniref:Antitoxin n=3 Tax=Verminephrobacter TaxID=364316 RepID=A0ABT3KW29_9BURK|nr:antitoxin [Verminephrobacter aporrectodeae subsp. tuberculatae]MCW5256817.1 antitoxin [Verminephrobacter aporrectodeae subsp. tuberculatae]MCW5288417.1 antitoxin [Verminephrobacter aporrectodeae subsp. tuberculatae]MCW5322010.1 antitoxin [Verminephrobacter aporrectodeae subsp. tuberculatae]MCW8164376.1 antitoxin [Verminephrobacter aporrectodeae subsp. tuberculatae]
MLDLGPDSKSIRYEVALDILGESRQPFMRAIHEEKQKSEPSQVFIRYCETRLTAIDELQDDLRLNDLDTIERILTKGNPLFKVD